MSSRVGAFGSAPLVTLLVRGLGVVVGRGGVGGVALAAALEGVLGRGIGGRVLTILAAARNDPHRHLPDS
ncbi:hypothetical protein [Actinomadura oligospora]|uniref:hypothetical protein n=1 Tax=Actinomadura oligospora TaxID=111804 RepID=UPI00047EF5C6|nr:hypothetical protein [Actinomadura oligospora]